MVDAGSADLEAEVVREQCTQNTDQLPHYEMHEVFPSETMTLCFVAQCFHVFIGCVPSYKRKYKSEE